MQVLSGKPIDTAYRNHPETNQIPNTRTVAITVDEDRYIVEAAPINTPSEQRPRKASDWVLHSPFSPTHPNGLRDRGQGPGYHRRRLVPVNMACTQCMPLDHAASSKIVKFISMQETLQGHLWIASMPLDYRAARPVNATARIEDSQCPLLSPLSEA